MTTSALPNIGDVLGPIVARVPAEQRPLFIAAAERLAGTRYRRWAGEVADAEQRAGLLACAQREDEIATRVESPFVDAAAKQRELLASIPGLDAIGTTVFDPYTLEQQFSIQAQAERLGAATWRSMARHAPSPRVAALFEGCAVLEEESAAYLESISKEGPRMDDTTANKQRVLDMYAALNAGNAAGYFAAMADDVETTYYGSHRLARTFRGKGDFMQNFVPVLRERLDGLIKMHITNAVAEGDQVVVEARGESRTKDGRGYNNLYCIVLKLKNGKITHIREYMDTELTKAIFG